MASSFPLVTTLPPDPGRPLGLLPIHYMHFCLPNRCFARLSSDQWSRPLSPKSGGGLFGTHPSSSVRKESAPSVGVRPTAEVLGPPAASKSVPVCSSGPGSSYELAGTEAIAEGAPVSDLFSIRVGKTLRVWGNFTTAALLLWLHLVQNLSSSQFTPSGPPLTIHIEPFGHPFI